MGFFGTRKQRLSGLKWVVFRDFLRYFGKEKFIPNFRIIFTIYRKFIIFGSFRDFFGDFWDFWKNSIFETFQISWGSIRLPKKCFEVESWKILQFYNFGTVPNSPSLSYISRNFQGKKVGILRTVKI